MIMHNFFKFSFIWNCHYKKHVLSSITCFKCDCIIKAREIFIFPSLINKSGTISLRFLSLCISEIISSKTINILRFLFGCVL